jgi:imidazolonepropionase
MTDAILYHDCTLATMRAGDTPYGLIEQGAVVISAGEIAWVGSYDDVPQTYKGAVAQSLGGRLVTPALVDCHTHLIFGDNRAKEFEMRLNGASYEEIAKAGGGILSTMRATRAASDEDLLAQVLTRVDALLSEGVGTIEIKSGYGLSVDQELRMLRVARQIGDLRDVIIRTTWLAAHALPPEYKDKADDYIDEVVITGLRRAHEEGLVDAVDGFCESIGFTTAQMRRIFDVAKALDLPVKLHAEQLSDQKGALLASEYNGLSADHLEYLNANDVPAFAQGGSVAVLLPGAYYTLGETQLPPIKALRAHDVPMAVATDCNPGSSPLCSLLTAMNMACTLFGLTPEEALCGTTRHAAKALGLGTEHGQIAIGYRSNLAVWDLNHPSELSYWIGGSPLHKRLSMRRESKGNKL